MVLLHQYPVYKINNIIIMKSIKIIILSLLTSFTNCKSQQVLPLNTLMENIPQGGYVKDLNNELVPFIGIYKANFQGNEITLYISKVENKLEERTNKSYYSDVLVVKYIVKNSAGTVLQDTQNNNNQIKLYSIRTAPQENAVALHYSGTSCQVGWGIVYLYKKNTTQIKWDYRPNSMALTEQNCPGNPDTTVYLPVSQDLIFAKQ
jgi:hypothetical protein